MTKHLYLCNYKNRAAYVLIGWDNNRKGFYMVFDFQNGSEEDAIFSNLFSKAPYPKTLGKYLRYLESIKVLVPEQMVHALLRDSFSKAEDREVTHIVHEGDYSQFESIDYAIL